MSRSGGIKNFTVCATAVALSGFACVGCGSGTGERITRVTSYVSTDSQVYSTTAEVVNAVADSVVEIRTESVTTKWGMQYVVSGAGSGVIVAHDADFSTYYVVTNNHVIEGANQIRVSLRCGDAYDAELIATDVRGDIAVVSIKEKQTLNVAVWGNSDHLRIGEDLIAIGNPLGSLGGTVTKGILSATERSISVGDHTMTLLQTDTAINPGNSGGGLFNMRGELVGVVNAKTSDEEVEGICFAIPANTARAICDELIADGVVAGRVTLGIEVAQMSDGVVYVTETNGANADFKKYDKVYSINGKRITSLLTFNDAVASLSPDETAEAVVYRGTVQSSFFGTTLSFDAQPTTFTVTARQISK